MAPKLDVALYFLARNPSKKSLRAAHRKIINADKKSRSSVLSAKKNANSIRKIDRKFGMYFCIYT
jgi:hypothetical protein